MAPSASYYYHHTFPAIHFKYGTKHTHNSSPRFPFLSGANSAKKKFIGLTNIQIAYLFYFIKYKPYFRASKFNQKTATKPVSTGVTLGMFQSLKRKTWQYLEQYDESITSMNKIVVDKIAAEL